MTPEAMIEHLQRHGRPLNSFKKGDKIVSSNYTYTLEQSPGQAFAEDFKPHLTPGEMLRLGVFEGKYLNDCLSEFPCEWFLDALALDKLRPQGPDVSVNLFKIKSRLPLSQWKTAGWVPSSHKSDRYPTLSKSNNPDERGWFQWYCRYWMGRRDPVDDVQIKRWKAFSRHSGAVKKNCKSSDLECRPRQRQALLQWAWNPFI